MGSALLLGDRSGRKEDYHVKRCKVFFPQKTIKLLHYLNVPMLTYLLLNYNVELILIYSGLYSTLIPIAGCPVKMQMSLLTP